MRDPDSLRTKAELLRSLHRKGRPLVLANVWDCATARVLEDAGAPAIATTSAGIAFSLGYPDGQQIPRERMLEAVARIVASVSVPVTADLEAGYGSAPEELAESVRGLLEAGAVGLNLEDHLGQREDPLVDVPIQLAKLRAARQAADRAGVPIVVNARTDPYLRGLGSPSEMLEEALRRGAAYRDAGADCVFVPGLADPSLIRRIVDELGCPINVLAGAGSPPIPELARLGVARVSLGSGPARAALGLLRRLVDELTGAGTYSLLEKVPSHASVNALMAKQPRDN